MKILHLITSLKIGGAESFLVSILEQFKQDTSQHYVVYFYDGPNVKKINNLGFKTYKISGLIKKYDPIFFFRLLKIVRKINPDLIHSSLWSANIFGRITAKLLKIPIVCDLHNDCLHNGKFRNFLDKITSTVPKAFVAVSNSVQKSFEQTIGKKAIEIRNGIDADSLVEKSKKYPISKIDLEFDQNDFVIGSIGRLEPIKSYDILIKAFAKLINSDQKKFNNIKLCIVGDGCEKNKLIKLAKKLGVYKKTYFAGFRADAYRFYPIFDCFALSSQTEGLSISILEALSFGLPIVATNHSLQHEVILHQKNGFLVPVDDVYKLCFFLQKIYADATLRARIQKDNFELARKKFSIRNTFDKYKKLYKNSINFTIRQK